MNFSYQPIANLKLNTIGLNIYRNGHGEYLMQDVVSFRLTEPMTLAVMQNVLGMLLSSDDEPLQFAPDPDETPGDAYIAASEKHQDDVVTWYPDSTAIKQAVYNPNGELTVTFNNDKQYMYYDVPRESFDAWMEHTWDGGSAGRYFNTNIATRFTFDPLDD